MSNQTKNATLVGGGAAKASKYSMPTNKESKKLQKFRF